MFECKLDGMFLRRLFESLKEICSDVSIDCSDEGLTMQAMDNSHISLIHLKLAPDFFHLYRCDLPCTLGINISFMLKILSVVKEKSLIYLSRGDMSEDPVLNIRIIEDVGANLTLESDSLEAQVKLIEVDREHLEIPSCDYSCKCVMNSKKFQEFAKYLHSIGETVTISMSENEMRLETEGEGIRASKRFHSDVGEVRVTSIENLSQIFATRYLVLFSKATNLAEQVSINLSAGIPLSVKFGFSDEEDTSFINFYLAPNIEE
ncbi:proliferating cell nuclear antigen 2 [Theileria orientalis strain Shintoku]|uniref:DNA sliding clamp PCNA n=1 Tax=Theileria orientalis strain Shintoku TaxID=869250 RepID=J4DP98_THEOR|nr:proliferating cell nuclear antigen 2 [Theileria orientalis strain Shintoku]PVC51662.1 proliferating cell nuclear antigen 2 [Theileria orientalis]BAM40329.1 proliferating cell nuclear antigen 2 [Theileria orientalis strain Shintoku]|eukprot:XP_009690630.1 proliferating cell nuclear antigen 2 [Theileria orientalis strain Shintoku]